MKKAKKITVKEFYDFIVKQITPEEALMKFLEGSVIQYENLKFKNPDEPIHPLLIIAMAAMDMGWQLSINEDEKNVNGLIVGTEEYMKTIYPDRKNEK